MTICPTCGGRNPDNAAFCDECGASLKSSNVQTFIQSPANLNQPVPPAGPMPAIRNCPVCGTPAQTGGLFCENCGASLASQISQSPVPAANLPPTITIPGAQTPANTPSAQVTVASPVPKNVLAPLPTASPTCSNCGAILEPDSAFCDMCGTPVKAKNQVIIPVVSSPDQPEIPAVTPESNSGFEATLVGGSAVPQSYSQPQVIANNTQQDFAPTQIGEYQTAPGFEPAKGAGVGNQQAISQPPAATYGAQQSNGQQQASFGVSGGTQAWLAIPGTNISLPLTAGKFDFIVGREDPINNIFPDIDLTDYGGDEGGVSRQHARITLQGNQYYLTDLQSTNSTYINQKRLQPNLPTLLHRGDTIRFGRTTVIFNY